MGVKFVQTQVVSWNTQWVDVYRVSLRGGAMGVGVPRDGSCVLPIYTTTTM